MEKLQEILDKLNCMGYISEPLDQEALETLKAESFNASSGSLNEEDDYECDICHNKGLILRPVLTDRGYWSTVSRECKCMAVRRTIKLMKRSGLKNIIKDYTFDKFEDAQPWQKTIKDAAIAYAKNPVGWFFIGGQSGAGKTHICTAICREFLLAGTAVKYMLWRDDVTKIKNLVTEADEYQKLIDVYKKVRVLYIDDLFKTGRSADGTKQRPTAADINVAFEILNYRYNDSKLLTIISSECTVNDILDIDEAVGGRIFERSRKAFSLKPDKSRNYRLRGEVEL